MGPRLTVHAPIAWALIVLAIGSFTLQLREAQRSADRRVGFVLEQPARATANAGLRVVRVAAAPDGPAARAGVRAGDRLVAVDGVPMRAYRDYLNQAAHFTSSTPVAMTIVRDGRTQTLTVRPGTSVDVRAGAVKGVVLACCLLLALLTLQRTHDLRARLLFWLIMLQALELAQPTVVVSSDALYAFTQMVFYVATGAQLAAELHLVGLLPARAGLLRRWPALVPGLYATGIALSTSLISTFFFESALPWTLAQAETTLHRAVMPLWSAAVVAILLTRLITHAAPRDRRQIALVLIGVLPWAIYVWRGALPGSATLAAASIDPLAVIVLLYVVAIWIAIARYHLFDIEPVVRQGLTYAALTGGLLFVFYGAVGLGGFYAAALIDGPDAAPWVIGMAMLVLGLLGAPPRQRAEQLIDHHLFPERRRQRVRLEALVRELPAQGQVPRMATHLAAQLRMVLAVKRVIVLVAEPEADRLLGLADACEHDDRPAADADRADALTPPAADAPATLLLPLESILTARLRALRRPVRLTSAWAREVSDDRSIRRLRARDIAWLVPLCGAEGQLEGLLAIGDTAHGRGLGGEELSALTLVAGHAGAVFENVRLFAAATYDGVTGLMRREAVHALLIRELHRALRHARPLAVAMVDIDHFKSINDTYGHLNGDRALRTVAEVLQAALRTTDVVGRYGGEEFVLIFPETELDGAAGVAERLRATLAATRVPLDEDQLLMLHVSIGVSALVALTPAQRTAPVETLAETLIASADAALYRAKGSGRNRVEIAPTTPALAPPADSASAASASAATRRLRGGDAPSAAPARERAAG
ncbi:MAG: diguanylate cyclase [Acidobacteriota bacterium]